MHLQIILVVAMLDKTVEANTTVSVFVDSNVKEKEAVAKLLTRRQDYQRT